MDEDEPDIDPQKTVYFDIQVGAKVAGRVLIELFHDTCPKTCENFRALCTGNRGRDTVTNDRLSYRGSRFHRVIPNYLVQGGDITAMNGTGGVSVFGGRFKDENFVHPHVRGCVSMANSGPDSNGSQFFVCLNTAPWLNGKHVVFGRVVAGLDVLVGASQVPRERGPLPSLPIVIVACGVLADEDKLGELGSAVEEVTNLSRLGVTIGPRLQVALGASTRSKSISEQM
eukprot:PhM_4_TR16489/c0_g1_i1/m.77355/K01802/E5.2.1.8; peptidylprolyl isomerase